MLVSALKSTIKRRQGNCFSNKRPKVTKTDGFCPVYQGETDLEDKEAF